MNQEEAKPGHKKVRILKFVGKHQPGDVVELPDAQAHELCKESSVHDGHKVVKFRKAVLLEEAMQMESRPVDLRKVTQKEMHDMGLKNIVPTPSDVGISRIIAKQEVDPSEKLVGTPEDLLDGASPFLDEGDKEGEESDDEEGEGEDEGSDATDEADQEAQPAKKASGKRKKKHNKQQ